ncbi:MAG: 4-(cytidine 5'-diphospho)-2-C-methyl-D-erythritol kinase [Tabrizicola sp.]|nr:4-(cytidine 5'-diphospho)-2-C-methyl-D-erythritol kinase [Tabrizicola sp.]
MTTEVIAEFAPAKINLTLHVTGRRADGYHMLDSLVVFADVGDRVVLRRASGLSLRIGGPQAGELSAGPDNLVTRAARIMGGDVEIDLEKNLPVASGIGGGSADAAATLRAMARMNATPLPDKAAVLALGADVPVCLQGRPARMRAVGDILDAVPPLPAAWLLLANPGHSLSTRAVFGALDDVSHQPMPAIPPFAGFAELARFLQLQRNDLEAPATRIAPAIGQAVRAIAAQEGCALARMSGSGATCFGLFGDEDTAARAASRIRAAEPGWWVAAAAIRG